MAADFISYGNWFTLSTNIFNKNLDPSEWVSQAEAARIRGVSRQSVWKLVRRRKLRTLCIGGRTFVNLKDLANFRPGRAGRPKGENKTI